jgi:hypothetical protein
MCAQFDLDVMCKGPKKGLMSYLTNYGQKKSINNIQHLDLSANSQHSIGRQLILLVFF